MPKDFYNFAKVAKFRQIWSHCPSLNKIPGNIIKSANLCSSETSQWRPVLKRWSGSSQPRSRWGSPSSPKSRGPSKPSRPRMSCSTIKLDAYISNYVHNIFHFGRFMCMSIYYIEEERYFCLLLKKLRELLFLITLRRRFSNILV